jgi:hypothetical protein
MDRFSMLTSSLLPVGQLPIIFLSWIAVMVAKHLTCCDEHARITLDKEAQEFNLC